MNMDLIINYIMLTEDPSDQPLQVFMGYTSNNFDLRRLMFATLLLPPSVETINISRFHLARLRVRGLISSRAFPLVISQASIIPFQPSSPLVVILSTAALDSAASENLSTLPFPFLHLASSDIDRFIEEPEFGRELIGNYVKKVALSLPPETAQKLLQALGRRRAPDADRTIFAVKWGHGVTTVNETPVELSGGKFWKAKRLIGTTEEPYIAAIKESFDTLLHERQRIIRTMPNGTRPRSVDLIVACPGLFHHLSNASRLKDTLQGAPDQLKKAFRYFSHQDSYFNSVNSHEVEELMKSPEFALLLDLWTQEISLFTGALCFQATNNFCPVIRLPRRLYQYRGLISLLGNALRSGNPKANSINNAARKVISPLTKEITSHYSTYFEGNNKQIRFCSDIPLGFATIDNLSINLRHYVSYLPTTPGNLFLSWSTLNIITPIDASESIEVLVIRSFKTNDPLRNILKECIEEYSKLPGWDTHVRFADVSSEQEFIDACNSFEGDIMIFDGHGSHKPDTQVGAIRIGDQDLDVWTLRTRVNIPRIVVLSCCDSYPSDRSHASTATGFLTLGAMAVFGSLFPINAIDAGLFVSRLLYRLSSVYRASIKSTNTSVSWCEIVTSQCRASYLAELSRVLVSKRAISEDVSLKISEEVIALINRLTPDWFNVLRTKVIEATGWPEEKFNRFLEFEFPFPHALNYAHLGYPERLIFVARHSSDQSSHNSKPNDNKKRPGKHGG